MQELWLKFKRMFPAMEFFRYMVSGAVATVVDLGTFTLLNKVFGVSKWYLSMFPAILLSILSAYAMNRVWVFSSKNKILPELLKFVGTRLLVSLIFQYLGYYLLYDLIGFRTELIDNLPWAKIISLVFVVIGNYVAGKLFVFKKVD